jgi:hypothetical protein
MLMYCANASPYEVGKPQHRIQTLSELAKQLHLNIVYVNQVGGQDDLILMVQVLCNQNGEVAYKHRALKKTSILLNLTAIQNYISCRVCSAKTFAEIYQGLVLQHVTMCNAQVFLVYFRSIRWYRLCFNLQLLLMQLVQIKFKP